MTEVLNEADRQIRLTKVEIRRLQKQQIVQDSKIYPELLPEEWKATFDSFCQ